MTTLFDTVLDLAQYCQGIEYATISSVSADGKQFTCSDLAARIGQYTNGGTCFFLDGDSAGQFISITSGGNQWIRLSSAPETTFAEGDHIALSAWRYFDTNRLVSAINHVLYNYPVMAVYDTPILTEEELGSGEVPYLYYPWQIEYDIPADVTTDIRRVEIECRPPMRMDPYHVTIRTNLIELEVQSGHQPEAYIICHYWKQEGNKLIIKPHPAYRAEGKFRIHYVKNHGYVFDPAEELDVTVDPTYIRMMASLFLWSGEIIGTHKDNPIAVDMFNQAKQYEEGLRKKNVPEYKLMQKDTCYYW